MRCFSFSRGSCFSAAVSGLALQAARPVLLLALTLMLTVGLSACGSGDSDERASGGELDTDVVGTVQIRFMRAPTTQEASFGLQPMTLADPSTVRIAVIHRPSGFRAVEDFPVPATVEANIPVPVADGYEVHGISFVNDLDDPSSGRFLLLKHAAQDGVVVARNETTNVSLVLEEIETNLAFPDEVEGGQSFSVNMGAHPALRDFGYVYYQVGPIDSRYRSYLSYPRGILNVTIDSPVETQEVDLYMISQRFISDDFQKFGETSNFWTRMIFYSPDVQRGQQRSIKVIPPEGSIGIDVIY